ncbi:MAG: glycoside hydrolase [Chitinophagaceae bacterium]
MKEAILYFIYFFFYSFCIGQTISLNQHWQFREAGTTKWYNAEIPGTVHTDLLHNNLLTNPFYRDNEKQVQWVEEKTWEYQTYFDADAQLFTNENIELQFDGLDTYTDVFLNGKKIISSNNMFRQCIADIKSLLQPKHNQLLIVFHPVSQIILKQKNNSSIKYPEERAFVRKAQYQFGWDWGPRLLTCGIWRDVRLVTSNNQLQTLSNQKTWNIKLVTKKDSIGESFYFTKNGKPVYVKGANWIPSDSFLPRAKKQKKYEQLIKAAKEANINMLRVWGGGVYEDDIFYELCDKYGIMVWQDFMFADALYPADSAFLKSVEEEVRYQVKRLRQHPCIALWCGNNEIEEAWFNWDWQRQFHYTAQDSLKLWNDYQKLFHQLILSIVNELDPDRPYWSSSPSLGWGRDSAYKKGDVHYWGVWWGKEPVKKYNEKVGRFNSEYGMQGMPDLKTIKQFTLPLDRDTASSIMRTHQKHPFGYENIKYYINQKFRTPKTFEDLVYVSQLMQADAIKTAIEAHRRAAPKNMGTMFWQWNDCWPVVSWSAIDYYGRKKALYYEVKRSYGKAVFLPHYEERTTKLYLKGVNELEDKVYVKGYFHDFIKGKIYDTDEYASIIYSLKDRETFMISNKSDEQKKNGLWCFDVSFKGKLISRSFAFAYPPKELNLPKVYIKYEVKRGQIKLSADKFAYGVYINVPDGVELEDNYFHLLPNEKKIIKFTSKVPLTTIQKQIKIKSLVDTF